MKIMKVICTDNYARETVADRLIVICSEDTAKKIAALLNDDPTRSEDSWFVVRPENYVLSKGMEDLV